MSCNYADGLSPYENKGILGVPEKFDSDEELETKCSELADLLLNAKHVVIHTGAGISTQAGIPDFRGPKGVWTLQEKGKIPAINVSFKDAEPTTTHMALRTLLDKGIIQYVITQNIDGLHLKSGIKRSQISELHGNMFVEQCSKCKRKYVNSQPNQTVGQKLSGNLCRGFPRPCRGGRLHDTILDWEDELPQMDLDLAISNSSVADLNIVLGSTLQITPSGNLPLKNKKYGGKLVICNLQPTKHDSKSDLIIRGYVDNIMIKVCKKIGIEIEKYDFDKDPTKQTNLLLEWNLCISGLKVLDKKLCAKNIILKKIKKK